MQHSIISPLKKKSYTFCKPYVRTPLVTAVVVVVVDHYSWSHCTRKRAQAHNSSVIERGR